MNISLDEQIKKDKERDRNSRNRQHRHSNSNSNRQGRYQQRDRDRQRQREREPRLVINISNLHYSVTREQLQELCERYGKVKSCRIQWDKMGRSNEKATVEYFNKTDSESAVQKLKGTVLEEQAIEAELVEQTANVNKRHEIRKNYGNRFRQFSTTFKPYRNN